MPIGDNLQAGDLSGLSPEQMLGAMKTLQGRERVQQSRERLEFDKARQKVKEKLEQRRMQIKEREAEVANEARKTQTKLNKQKANRLKIKRQIMEGLMDKQINTPYGEMSALEAKTMGIRPQTNEIDLQFETWDGVKHAVTFNPQTNEITTKPLGEDTDAGQGGDLSKWESLDGKVNSGSDRVLSLYGVSEWSGLSPDAVPKARDAMTIMELSLREGKDKGKTVTPGQAAREGTQVIDNYDKTLNEIQTSDQLSRSDAIERAANLLKTAHKYSQKTKEYGLSTPERFSPQVIKQTFKDAGYDEKKVQDLMQAAKQRVIEGD